MAPDRARPALDEAAWDAEVVRLGGGLLQTWRWGAFKARHGWSVARVRAEHGGGTGVAQILFKHKGPLALGYIPRGPLLSSDDPALWAALLRQIDRACRGRRTISAIVEPERALPALPGGPPLVAGPARIQPARTVKVPLLADDALLAQMHQKTRYNIRYSLRKGVAVSFEDPAGPGFDEFYTLMEDTAERNEYAIHSRAYYRDALATLGDQAALAIARIPGGEAAAALVATVSGPEAVYLYGASSTRHRAMQPGFALQFETMRWARSRGCRAYDLWGIPATNPETTATAAGDRLAGTRGEDWRGLYEFKVRFGGEIVSYPEPVERRYLPLLPALARRFYGPQG
jgi:lipid II:glycine glycyltransferase (peptidoglycan interpeptide bridge formation enzyme)